MYERTIVWLIGLSLVMIVVSKQAQKTLTITRRMQGWKRAFRDQMILEERNI